MCMELLGFDIFIDNKYKPWLIEVNLAPSFNQDTETDKFVKRNLLTDTFKLMGMSGKERARKQN